MHQSNYGQYEVPRKLLELIELQKELDSQGLLQYGNLLGLSFMLESVEGRYLNTPVDVIPFAWTGSDGGHFGFLTDFGQVSSLQEAYIVRISPMDFDEPVKLVARHLNDFIALMYQYRYAVEVLDVSSSQTQIERFNAGTLKHEKSAREQSILDAFYEKFKPETLPSLTDYFLQLKKDRAAAVVVDTDDGIGVIKACASECIQQIPFALERDLQPNLDEVKMYFAKSPLEYKLAFIRDAQSYAILFDEPLLKQFIIEELQRLNLGEETLRLSYS